ncbi:MAG: (Fe-S)-binding protein, partial [Alphaproteobacteria bacterium]|nr:(Fe-S)-binding protein [Alphaproteobacteria bacterium]
DSEVSKLSAARGGYALMPEQNCKPVNRYLPPRPRKTVAEEAMGGAGLSPVADSSAGVMARWLDKILSL